MVLEYFRLDIVLDDMAGGAYMSGASTEAHISMSEADGTSYGDAMSEMVEQPASEARDIEGGVGGGGSVGGEGEGSGDSLGGETGDQGSDMGGGAGSEDGGGSGDGGGGYVPTPSE